MDLAINGARVLFEIENVPLLGTVQITQTLTVSWLVFAIITGLCIWLGKGLTVTGISRKQAVSEMIVGALVNFVRGNMGTEFDHYIPLVGTIFITSVISNLISLLGIWSPTADLMTELAWALVVFVLFWALKKPLTKLVSKLLFRLLNMKQQWISKEDTGTESNTEKEKGLASDSFKRACFNWGIGRELYTAPNIKIKPEDCTSLKQYGDRWKCFDTFEVQKIIIEQKKIVALAIKNTKSGKTCFVHQDAKWRKQQEVKANA